MNDLSNGLRKDRHCCIFEPFPASVLYVLIPLFFIGFTVSIFIFVVVHNGFFFVFIIFLSLLVLAFLIWNTLSWRRNRAILLFLNSFHDSDLRFARDGQLVKITGFASCGNISLESSYEKVPSCVYTSTVLYEYRGFALKPANMNNRCFEWSIAYSERFSTEFYINDLKSGIRAMVKAGYGSKVTPLIVESTLVNTTNKHTVLSSYFKKWLGDKNLSSEARLFRLDEGYIMDGSSVTVLGVLQRNNDTAMIVHPPELISTGCFWRKLLLPADVDGIILRISETGPAANQYCGQDPEQ